MLKKLRQSASLLVILCTLGACASEPVLQSKKTEVFQGLFKQNTDFLTENKTAEPSFLKDLESDLLKDLYPFSPPVCLKREKR